MHIDCDHCAVRGPACGGCVVTVLLGSTPDGVEWDETERAALGVLADSGLVPPLRLVPASQASENVQSGDGRGCSTHSVTSISFAVTGCYRSRLCCCLAWSAGVR